MPRAVARTRKDGVETVYQGVWLHEILKRAGVTKLRGPGLGTYVLARAEDNYQVVFSLAELDPDFAGNRVLLADSVNGRFRLIAEKEKRAALSVRMLTKIEVVTLKK